MLFTILLILLVVNALVLIVSILLQPRSQDGIGAAFGGGVADNIFGGKGGLGFLTKLTAVLSIVFVIIIMAINFTVASPGQRQGPAMERDTSIPGQQIPAGGAPPAGGGAQQQTPPPTQNPGQGN